MAKQDVIDAIAAVAVASTAVEGKITDLRDAVNVLNGGIVSNSDITNIGNSTGAVLKAADTFAKALSPLVATLNAAIVEADAQADLLT